MTCTLQRISRGCCCHHSHASRCLLTGCPICFAVSSPSAVPLLVQVLSGCPVEEKDLLPKAEGPPWAAVMQVLSGCSVEVKDLLPKAEGPPWADVMQMLSGYPVEEKDVHRFHIVQQAFVGIIFSLSWQSPRSCLK